MDAEQLAATARELVAPGKGILAADESTSTILRRFKSINLPSTMENRQAYRDMLFTTPELGHYISGVILYDETIRQTAHDGTPFAVLLARSGMIPGIKVDTGAKDMANFPGETITEGLDGLRERLAEYAALGARFTKWRAVITIGDGIPSAACIRANAEALARFAALSQEAGLAPIVEPEVLMDGDHSIERCAEVTEATQKAVFQALFEQRVALEGMLLKPNMVLSGQKAVQRAGVHEVAQATVRVLLRTVPAAVPGIVFLSGGQGDVEASEHLDAMNRLATLPWRLSFSYGRALQAPALAAWQGAAANVHSAQQALALRARLNSAATQGRYSRDMER